MTPRFRRTAGRILCLVLVLSLVGAASADPIPEVVWRLTPRPEGGGARLPAPPAGLPIQLFLDDESAEGAAGVAVGSTARQFLWFNRFSLAEESLLEEIWVLYSPGPNMTVGNAVQLAVYHDADADPGNGATLLATYDETIEVLDGVTFSVYELAAPLALAPGDILIGVVDRFVASGVTGLTFPAAIDTTASQGRSWLATWTGDPPSSPTLPSDEAVGLLDSVSPAAAGNWMIRGFARPLPRQSITEIPTLGPGALGLLALLIGAAAVKRLRGRGASRRGG